MAYWLLALAITVFGFISGFSIGLPILLVGLTMLALGPFRRRELVFWPVLLGVLGFVVTFMAIAPFSCSGTAGVGEGAAPANTVCTSLIGIQYVTTGFDNPSFQPFLLVSLVVGVVVGAATYLVISRRRAGLPAQSV